MSYNPGQGHHVSARVPSGIAFFGTDATDPVYMGDSSFIIDDVGQYIEVPNVKVSDGGTIGSQTTPGAITVATNGDVTLSNDMSITGNLTVNGTTTTVNSTVVTIEDPIIILGSGSPSADDNKDRGISFNYYSGSAKTGFFGWDDSAGKMTFIPDASISSEVVSGSVGTILANLEGNVTGNASTATTLATTRTFSVTGDTSATAQNFNGSANVTLSTTLQPSAISGRAAITSVDGANDYLLIWDATDSALKKVTRSNFVSGLGTMSSFDISDGSNTQTLVDSDTLTFASGADIFFQVSATDTVSAFINAGAVTAVELNASVAGNGLTGGGGTALAVGAGNGITVNANDVALASSTAGNGLTYTNGVLAVGAGSLIDVTADAVDVDLTEAAAATIAAADHLIFLDGGASGAASKGSISGLATVLAGNGLVANSTALDINTDNSTVELNSDTLRVKDGGITEAKRTRSVASVSTTSTISSDINLCAGGAGGITVTLPAVASGKLVIVKKTDSAAGPVTILRGGSSTIDGATQKILYAQYESMTLASDGTNWFIV